MKTTTTNTAREIAALLAAARKGIADKNNGTTTGAEAEARMPDSFWIKVDTLTLSEDEARDYLARFSSAHPVDGMVIANDFDAHCIRHDYIVDKRKGDGGKTKLHFVEGKNVPTIDRIMEHAMEGKVSMVSAVEVKGVNHVAYFGIDYNGQKYRTGKVANTALAIAKAMGAKPIVLLGEEVPGYIEA